MKVAELVEALSRNLAPRASLKVNEEACQARGIRLQGDPPSFYVPPELEPADGAAPANFFCYLLSAPAAVGKTSLAHYLMAQVASTKQYIIYVPLQKAVIGQGFFAGLLADLFPNSSKEEVLTQLFHGNLLMVFDGYDEVSVTAEQLHRNKLFNS
jgi:hypothetical protein